MDVSRVIMLPVNFSQTNPQGKTRLRIRKPVVQKLRRLVTGCVVTRYKHVSSCHCLACTDTRYSEASTVNTLQTVPVAQGKGL